MTSDLPFLQMDSPDFSTKSADVINAQRTHWCAKTPFGFAILRHKQAGHLLRDRRLRQGSHNWPSLLGLTGSFAEFWQRSLISTEGPVHRTLRQIAVPALAPDFVQSLVPAFEQSAQALTQAITAAGHCEFMRDFSSIFAGHAICILLGLPLSSAPSVSKDAAELGLAMGVTGKRFEPRFNAATDRLMALAERLIKRARAGDDQTSYVARLVHNFDKSALSDQQALRDLIVISIFGGVDTTRAQLGIAMALFAKHPKQWAALRADPTLAPNAVEECIQAHPTTTWATREVTQAFTLNDVDFPQNAIVHILVHATARDPAICDDPSFDITKPRKSHFGFGGGAHHCLGHLVARADIACALRALAASIERITLTAAPEWMPDSGNTAPIGLPLKFERFDR